MGSCFSSNAVPKIDPYAIPKPVYHPQVIPPPQPPSTQTEPFSAEPSLVVPPPPVDDPSPPRIDRYKYIPPTTAYRSAPESNGAPYITPVPAPVPAPAPATYKHKHDFYANYALGKRLGEGAFATVFVGTHKASQQDYAIKCVNRMKMQWGDRDALQDEIENLQEVKGGPNIVQLIEVYTPNPRECYLVMELLQGGELFERILQKRTFTEKEARNVARGLLKALQFMHSKRIAHRDLKPENLLLQVRLECVGS